MSTYPNGRAPDSALVTYRGCKASPDMARRVAWVEREYMRRNPSGYITPNEIYRDYDAQVYWLNYWTDRGQPGNAATPGYSNHGDYDIGAVDWDCDNIGLRTELADQVGLVRTIASESWHYANRHDPYVDLSAFAYEGSTPIDNTPDRKQTDMPKMIRSGGIDALVGPGTLFKSPNEDWTNFLKSRYGDSFDSGDDWSKRAIELMANGIPEKVWDQMSPGEAYTWERGIFNPAADYTAPRT